ncbi:MAG: SIMPL domain-containing protein [Polyangiaceae bacterium]
MKTKPQSTTTGTLTVTGDGQIKVRPDLAILDLDVVTTAKTAQEASQDNAQRMSAVTEALRDVGLVSADLQTVGYDVMPIIDTDEKSPTKNKITGYRVASQLRVRADVDRAGETIDAAIEAGANMASGIRYAVRDENSVRARALKAAVKAARRDADAIADSIAVKIRSVEALEANMGGAPILFRSFASLSAKAMTPVEPGNVDITASVRVVYRYA